jgi:hypothetical protein
MRVSERVVTRIVISVCSAGTVFANHASTSMGNGFAGISIRNLIAIRAFLVARGLA